MAEGHDQGIAGEGAERAAESGIHRDRLQFLPVYPGQYRGGRFRRQRRELDQDIWARVVGTGTVGEGREDRDRQGPRRSRCSFLQSARPAESDRADRPCRCCALWLFGQRHQYGGSGCNWRARGYPCLRRRNEFRADRAPCSELAHQRGGDPLDPGRAAEPGFERAAGLYRAWRSRRGTTRSSELLISTARTASASCL